MKMNHSATLRMMATGEVVNKCNDVLCTRGLECRTREGSRRRQVNKMNALCAVLDEQERQFVIGIHDELKLSLVYIRMSTHCAEIALATGLNDSRDVRCMDQGKWVINLPATSLSSSMSPDTRQSTTNGRMHQRIPTPLRDYHQSTSKSTSKSTSTSLQSPGSDTKKVVNSLRQFFLKSQSEKRMEIKNDIKSMSSQRSYQSQ